MEGIKTVRSSLNRCKRLLQGPWDRFQIVIQAFNIYEMQTREEGSALGNVNIRMSHQYFTDRCQTLSHI